MVKHDESSSFFFIKAVPHFSSTGQPFCLHVIFHIPFKSESRVKQDGVYRFQIGPSMAKLWPFIGLMAMGKTFPSHL